jgi:uridine monophosphate synthetase
LIDGQSAAKESLAQAEYKLQAMLTITELLDYWERTGKVEKDRIEATVEFPKRAS